MLNISRRVGPTPSNRSQVQCEEPVMLDEFMQDQAEVVWSGDQEMVETFAAQRANPAFRDDVCSWCSYRGADDAEADAREHRVERGGELGISVADQEREPAGVVAEVHKQVAGLLGHPGTGGMAVIPAMCTLRVACSITTST
jgi:hypothetical protein